MFQDLRLPKFTTLTAFALAACACSAEYQPSVGVLSLGLSSMQQDNTYQLRNALFVVEGASSFELSTDDDPSTSSLQRSVPSGQYQVTLIDGWQLELVSGATPTVVAAELVSSNPLAFEVQPGATTPISFKFRTSEVIVALDDGDIELSIEVESLAAPGLIITEFMKDPNILLDSAGEWLELYNGGADPVSLENCELVRDGTTTLIAEPITVAPGGHATIARTPDPGFVPSYIWSGLSLPNTTAVAVAINCGGVTVDQVTFDALTFPNEPGKSASLSAGSHDRSANDVGTNWCSGVASYNGDLGTPGSLNPACP